MCFMYAFLMSNETVLSVERFCTCLTFISHSIMDTSHMPLKWFFFFFLPIENIAYTVCTVAWFSLHWLLMHDLLNHISDLVPYIVSTISLETDDLSTLSFIPRCGRRPLCGSFHGGMRPPIRSFQYLVKDEFIS